MPPRLPFTQFLTLLVAVQSMAGFTSSRGFDTTLVFMQIAGPFLMLFIIVGKIKIKGERAIKKRREKKKSKEESGREK